MNALHINCTEELHAAHFLLPSAYFTFQNKHHTLWLYHIQSPLYHSQCTSQNLQSVKIQYSSGHGCLYD